MILCEKRCEKNGDKTMSYIKHRADESLEDYLETILMPVSYTHLTLPTKA